MRNQIVIAIRKRDDEFVVSLSHDDPPDPKKLAKAKHADRMSMLMPERVTAKTSDQVRKAVAKFLNEHFE